MKSQNPVNEAVETYQLGLIQGNRPEVIQEMEAYAKEKHFPIVGPLVGTFLRTLTQMIRPKRIFEFGSGFGYSAYWFASGAPDAEIICTDSSKENIDQAETYLKKAGIWDKVSYHQGIAQEVFPKVDGTFDILYNDVDKEGYPEVWEMAKKRLNPGGLYICDNVIWGSRVAFPPEALEDKRNSTAAIIRHNQTIFNDPEFESFINPTRDGVLVARKR